MRTICIGVVVVKPGVEGEYELAGGRSGSLCRRRDLSIRDGLPRSEERAELAWPTAKLTA